MNRKSFVMAGALITGVLAVSAASAKVSPEKAKELDGPVYTCYGAEKAVTQSGVAAYSGKWFGTWPGQTKDHGFEPGPYKDEKPQFTITSQNMAQYAAKMTEGEKALMTKYPSDYRMNVYPAHRDFRNADCA